MHLTVMTTAGVVDGWVGWDGMEWGVWGVGRVMQLDARWIIPSSMRFAHDRSGV
jgi:hypothetical protein